jgi:carboxyl-terminal processing protease
MNVCVTGGLIVAACVMLAGDEAHQAPAAGTAPATDQAKPDSAEEASKLAWSIMDVILARHIDPPTRQEMMLGAARGLVNLHRGGPPARLGRQISGMTTYEQFQSLVKELWPKPSDKSPAATSRAMVEGVLAAVAGNNGLMSPTLLRVESQVAASRYVGIGVQYSLNKEEDVPQVVTPFRGGPAHRAGVKPGDLLVSVDGKKTKGIGLEESASWVRGQEGKPVTIVFRQPKSTAERTLRIVRGVIPIETVLGYRREGDSGWRYRIDPSDGVGYIWINAIHSSTLHELRQVETKLRGEGIRALVIDLRYSAPGTQLHQAEMVGDSLVGGGLMWRMYEGGENPKEYRSSRECLFRDWPMAILLSEEINDPMIAALAAALADNGRAILVGEMAKAGPYVKTLLELGELGGTMLQTAKLERPTAERGWPPRPDQPVETTPLQRALIEKWLFEKELTELPKGVTDEPPVDPQLSKAVALLKRALEKKATSQAQSSR